MAASTAAASSGASASVSDHFAHSYREARQKFLGAAAAAGLAVTSHAHPLPGRDGETLAMDVVRDGPQDASAVLLVSSACHGVEGYCGSGIQGFLLGDAGFREATRAAGVAVVHIHALNPYGFSWLRRVTHENVDLNRNFHDFSRSLPANPGYDELASLIVPPTWPPSPEVDSALQRFVAERGMAVLQQAISGGQYSHPDGAFYGGRAPTWSQLTLRRVLRDEAGQCARLGWIDLHTGLGPSGVGERIFACRADPAALQRARAWWGTKVTSIDDGSSSSAPLVGLMWGAAYQECPQAAYTGIALEYGTLPLPQMLDALRADQWLYNHPEAGADQRDRIKRQIFEAFFVDTDEWKAQVVEQALDAALGGVRGLAAGSESAM